MTDLLQLSFLPRDILFQILVRLGARSRGKLSCVSKSFRSILTDPSFAEFHRNWSAALNHGTTILFSIWHMLTMDHHHPLPCPVLVSTPHQFYTINYTEDRAGDLVQAKIVPHMDKVWVGYGRSVSFAKDQICFFHEQTHPDLNVLNLAAGQRTTLPAIPGFSCALSGYDGVSGTYKVLLSVINFYRRTVKYWVFTLGADKTWREIKSPVLFYLSRRFMNSVCINGVIYSYNELCGRWWETFGKSPIGLVAFDVRSESFHLIPLPPTICEEDVRKSSLLEFRGLLAVIYLHQNKQFIAWTLGTAAETTAKSTSCWKKHTFPFPLGSELFSKPFITATPAGEIVVLTLNGITSSLWVLLDKFGADSIWKKIRIMDVSDCPSVKEAFEVVDAQNIVENLFHLK
ncbi:unnamed protein product [Cuscuta epithymum]|uniref:F-box domain-containing protein n=1 Tax=Cuscuta epithymum TaxID=186058 RepID=A0AAV0EUU3_9ASTE|nr:unnamed protein product [Cuscuta epithymum]